MDINNFNKNIANIPYTNFLCLLTDDTQTWDNHIDQLISILDSACYAITAVKAMLSRKDLRKLHFPYVHLSYPAAQFLGVTPLMVLKY